MSFKELTHVWLLIGIGNEKESASSDVQGTHRAKTKIRLVAAFEIARSGPMHHKAVQYL